jgi:zinc protease
MPIGGTANFFYESAIRKGLIQLMWPTDDIWNIERKRHLDFLSEILQDRIRLKIRKEMGDTYSPSVYNFASSSFDSFGYICATALVDENRIDEIAKIMEDVATELLRDGINDDEFLRVKEPMQARIKELLRDNSYWIHALDGVQAYPQKLEFIRTLPEFYTHIQREDVKNVLKYLDQSRRMLIKIRPQ